MSLCQKCGLHDKIKRRSHCIECERLRQRTTKAATRKTPDGMAREKKFRKKHYDLHREKILKRNRELRNANLDHFKELRKRSREKVREYEKKYRLLSFNRRMYLKLTASLNDAIRRKLAGGHVTEKHSSFRYCGADIETVMKHIESQFKGGMEWKNRGKYWSIDHIIPLSSGNLSDEKDVLRLCHYTNLQPLTVEENSRKFNKIL
jgi:hypothetical protein